MKKNKKLIDLYKEWMEEGEIPSFGLCGCVKGKYADTLEELIRPTEEELDILWNKGLDKAFWGSGLRRNHYDERTKLTPLRQTIVLLICAIHNEL